MAELKGMVISLEKKKMVVVTEEGDFLKVPIPACRPLPGQTVSINPDRPQPFTIPIWLRVTVAVLIVSFSALMFKPLAVPQAVAAVSMDLASSVELTIDKQNRVLSTRANNPQGEEVLRGLDLEDMDIYQAVNTVTNRAVQLGYLQNDGKNTIMVTVAPLIAQEKINVDRNKLQQTMHDELVKQKYKGYLVVNKSEDELWQEAEKMGLTVNQYLLWKKSQEQKTNIELDNIRQQPLAKIADDEAVINEIFPDTWCHVGESEHETSETDFDGNTGSVYSQSPAESVGGSQSRSNNQQESSGADGGTNGSGINHSEENHYEGSHSTEGSYHEGYSAGDSKHGPVSQRSDSWGHEGQQSIHY